jgi:uroporphyrinogen-III decarboxylase
MDKRSRVLSALNKKPVDHVPVGFWFHFSGEALLGEPCIQAHLKYYLETDLDFLKIMSDGYFPYPVNEPNYMAGPKMYRDPDITAEDLWKMDYIRKDNPWITGQVERAARIVGEIGGERCVFYNIFSPFSSLKFATSDAAVMKFAREDKNALKHALDIVAQGNALLGELLIKEAGCDGLYYCVQNAEFTRFTEEQYRDLIRPSDLYVLEHLNRFSENNILHCCGFFGNQNRINLWYDYPVKCVNWATHVENIPLHEGRYLFGSKAILGGFDTHWEPGSVEGQRGILYHGTREELQAYTRELILNTGKLGLLLGGDCTTDSRIDIERIKWIVEAARTV